MWYDPLSSQSRFLCNFRDVANAYVRIRPSSISQVLCLLVVYYACDSYSNAAADV